jgi:hypothetical protein
MARISLEVIAAFFNMERYQSRMERHLSRMSAKNE